MRVGDLGKGKYCNFYTMVKGEKWNAFVSVLEGQQIDSSAFSVSFFVFRGGELCVVRNIIKLSNKKVLPYAYGKGKHKKLNESLLIYKTLIINLPEKASAGILEQSMGGLGSQPP